MISRITLAATGGETAMRLQTFGGKKQELELQ